MQFDISTTVVANVAHVIQLAVAPVFLLTGIGAMLGVIANRLGRVVDRARVIEQALPDMADPERALVEQELATLARRGSRISWATSLCVASAIFISMVVAALFIGAFLSMDVSLVVVGLFIFAMLALIGGLITFLSEVHLATMTLRIGAKLPR